MIFNKEHKFKYLDNTLRVVYLDSIPWFNADDIAKILDDMNPRYLIGVALEKDESKHIPTKQYTDAYYINIKGVFRCLTDKNLHCAETYHFEHWFLQNLSQIFMYQHNLKQEKEIIIENKKDNNNFEAVYDKLLPALSDIEELKKDVKKLFELYF